MNPARPRGADPTLLRQLNAVNTLRVLYRHSPLTLTRLVEATGLARRTAEAAVEHLIAEGLAAEVAPAGATRGVGRPARSFRFRAEAGHVLGLDLNVHGVTAVLVDLAGTPVARHDQSLPRSAGRADRIAAAAASADACRRDAGITAAQIWATTAGTPGLVTDDGQLTVCHVLPEWSDFPLGAELARGLTATTTGPVHVENDTNLAALAERWCGIAQDVDSMVWVLTGRRISAAIVIDGQLYRGADGAAGEIGWVSELGWSQLSDHRLSYSGLASTDAGATAAAVIARAAAADTEAIAELEEFAAALATGLTALVLVVNPRCLVVGGGISVAGDLLLDALTTQMRPHCLRLPELRISTLGPDAVSVGATRHALDRVEAQLFDAARAPA